MARNGNDLLARIVKDPTKVDEVEIILVSYFGGAAHIEPGKIRYGDQIDVSYSKHRDEICQIEPLRDLPPKLISGLEAKLDEAVYSDHGLQVSERYFFTCPQVEGALRVGNSFQITPAHDSAPKPDFLIGQHPAILVFRHGKSPEMLINQLRRDKRSRELLFLFNVLIRGPISWTTNTGQHKWVWEALADGVEGPKFAYRQVGYAPKIGWDQRDDIGFLVNPDWTDIPRKEHSPYYGDLGGIRVGEPFQLPDSFEASLERYDHLTDNEKALFQRSAYWLATYSTVFQQSRSLAFVSLVHALEALLPNPKKTGQCEGCGRDQFDKSISDLFREFLEEYGAGLPREAITEIYKLRSAIAHGGGLMPGDREIIGFRFNVEQNEKDEIFRRLHNVCEVVLINWLLSDNRTLNEVQP